MEYYKGVEAILIYVNKLFSNIVHEIMYVVLVEPPFNGHSFFGTMKIDIGM